MKSIQKKDKTMNEVTKGYEEFMKGKELTENGRELFSKAIKKATKIKQRGSK